MNQNSGAEQIESALSRLSVTLQTRLVQVAAQGVVRASQQRIADQTDLSGAAFKARQSPRNKLMLAGLMRNLRVLSSDGNQATVGFTGNMGNVAAIHQHGATTTVSAKKGNAPTGGATLRQAVELVKLGYTAKQRKPSVSELQNTLSARQARAIIRTMRDKSGIATKTNWQITTPARAFLGVSETDKQALLADMITTLNEAINQ